MQIIKKIRQLSDSYMKIANISAQMGRNRTSNLPILNISMTGKQTMQFVDPQTM